MNSKLKSFFVLSIFALGLCVSCNNSLQNTEKATDSDYVTVKFTTNDNFSRTINPDVSDILEIYDNCEYQLLGAYRVDDVYCPVVNEYYNSKEDLLNAELELIVAEWNFSLTFIDPDTGDQINESNVDGYNISKENHLVEFNIDIKTSTGNGTLVYYYGFPESLNENYILADNEFSLYLIHDGKSHSGDIVLINKETFDSEVDTFESGSLFYTVESIENLVSEGIDIGMDNCYKLTIFDVPKGYYRLSSEFTNSVVYDAEDGETVDYYKNTDIQFYNIYPNVITSNASEAKYFSSYNMMVPVEYKILVGDEDCTETYKIAILSDAHIPGYRDIYKTLYLPKPDMSEYPEFEKREFLGWCYKNGQGKDVFLETEDNLSYIKTSSEDAITLYACYKKAEFTVTFAIEGDIGTPVDAVTVQEGQKVTNPNKPDTEVIDGYNYDFSGWYLGESLYDFDAPVTGNIELTANYTKHVYTVTDNTGTHVTAKSTDDGIEITILKKENSNSRSIETVEEFREEIRLIEKNTGTYFVINPEYLNNVEVFTFTYPFVKALEEYEFEFNYNYPDPSDNENSLNAKETFKITANGGIGELDYSEMNTLKLELTESGVERYIGFNSDPKAAIDSMFAEHDSKIQNLSTTFVFNSGKTDWTNTAWVNQITNSYDVQDSFFASIYNSTAYKTNFLSDEYYSIPAGNAESTGEGWSNPYMTSSQLNTKLSERETYFAEFRVRFTFDGTENIGMFSTKDITSEETEYNLVNRDSGVTIKLPEIATPVDFNIIATAGTSVIEDSAFITSNSELTFSIPDTIDVKSIVWATGLIADGSEKTYTISAAGLTMWDGLVTVSCRVVDTDNKVWVSSISFIVTE